MNKPTAETAGVHTGKRMLHIVLRCSLDKLQETDSFSQHIVVIDTAASDVLAQGSGSVLV